VPTLSLNRPTTEPTDRGRTMPEQVADAIRRHRAGDRNALTDLVRIVTPWLTAVARGFGLSAYSAEDVVQATLLAMVRGVDNIRSPDAGVGWLAVAARHEAVRVARAERAVEPVAEIEVQAPGSPDPEAIVIERLRRKVLRRHLAELPARGQVILNEIAQGGRPDYAAISEQTGMPVGSIGPTRGRSLRRMRERLEADQDWLAFAG